MGGEVAIKAAVCREFGKPLTIETLTLSPPPPRHVRVNLSTCAICHSDIIYMDGGWGGTPPIVFGHEGAGVVEAVGEGANFSVGARVIVTLLRSCGDCPACARGVPSQCEGVFDSSPRLHDADGKPVGIGLKTAAFAEQAVVHDSQIAVIPDDMPYEQACLLSCGVITGWGAVVNTACPSPGDSVAVVGCGGVGLNCLQAAAAAGASPIAAIDIAESKLAIAKDFGATHAILANDSLPQRMNEITDGRGFDYVLMAAGNARAVEQSAPLLARTGALILVGMAPNGDLAKLDTTTIANNHQRILGSKMGGARLRTDIPKLTAFYQNGRLKLAELIGNRYPLNEINDAVAEARHGGALRNVIVF